MTDIEPAVLLSFRNNLRSCHKCDLATDTNHPVPWSGPLHPTYAVLGEAPGGQESRYSEPFVGPAGIALKYAMKSAGINPAEVAFVHSVACKPVNSAIPTLQHIDACRPWMRGQMAFLQPQIVISCGVVALQSIRGHDNWPKIANLHGKPLWWDNPPAPLKSIVVWPIYHPTAGLRSAKYRRLIDEDLKSLVAWVAAGKPWPEGCWICGQEVTRYTEWGIGLCDRHAARMGQGMLWEESA